MNPNSIRAIKRFLAASALLGVSQLNASDRPGPLPLVETDGTISTKAQPVVVTSQESKVIVESRIVTGPAPACRVAPRRRTAFIVDNTRYEPVIRDIRMVPNGETLPGGAAGQRETLPSLPAKTRSGYFLLPIH